MIVYANRRVLVVVAAVSSYFGAAYWLKITYREDPNFTIGPSVPGEKVQIWRPFVRARGSAFGKERYSMFEDEGDTPEFPRRSTVELYENGMRLGPSHSDFEDIATIGQGRFSHTKKNGATLYWSTSDNSDPNTNGRAYWVVKPPAATKPRP